MANTIYEELKKTKLLPLYTVNNLDSLDILETVLLENEIEIVEITFRSRLALTAIKRLVKNGHLRVGAGTVRSLTEAQLAVENGASFVVSPAVIPEVIEYCQDVNIPVFPGVATPGDIQQATTLGIKRVKFFPADIYGGLKALDALSGPFYEVEFLPTGGVNQTNILDYLTHPKIFAVGGSFIVSEKELVEDQGVSANNRLKNLVDQLKETIF